MKMSGYCQRLRTMDAISRSSIHQSLATTSSQMAMERCRGSTVTDPNRALDLIRSLIQSELNAKIQDVMQEYINRFFEPAYKNMQRNLGSENVNGQLIQEVCVSALDHAKKMFTLPKTEIDNKPFLKRKSPDGSLAEISRSVPRKKAFLATQELPTDLILISKQGLPVRREGDKWDPKRLTPETLFVLGSKANRALGLGQNRGRLYIKHPSLFRYCCDQSDKEWLAEKHLISSSGGKAYLMILQDIHELSETKDYSSYPKAELNELSGFKCPSFMMKKMSAFVRAVRTDPSVPDRELLQQAHLQIAKWNSESSKALADLTPVVYNVPGCGMSQADLHCDPEEGIEDDASLLGDMPDEDEDDDLGFLQGVNLSSLVREFELEASSSGSQNIDILSLADDNESAFPQLHDTSAQDSEHDLNDIDFD